MFQELNARAQITTRHPASASAGIYLMQLRAQSTGITLPRRRFMISVEVPGPSALPHPVKINHVQTAAMEEQSPIAASSKVPHVRPDIG